MKKILFVTAAPETVSAFLCAYLNKLSESYDVHVATTLRGATEINGLKAKVVLHDIEIAREPSIFSDFKSLLRLYSFVRTHKFDAVHSFTPKAGLLTQISAFAARVPLRFHTFTGQVWANKTGIARFILKSFDRVTAQLSTFCLVDSPSQQEFLIKEGLLTNKKSDVLAQGSVSGVNLNKFSYSNEARSELRAQHKVSEEEFVFLFVGRLKIDKGIPELVKAFNALTKQHKAKLFVIGSDEDNLAHLFDNNPSIESLGFKTNVSEYYAFADILCLPSHREGFGNVIIEAAACNLPAIASDIYGLSDAVQNGYSGLLHKVKSEADIKRCMKSVIEKPELLQALRENGKKRVKEVFDEEILLGEFIDFYCRFLR